MRRLAATLAIVASAPAIAQNVGLLGAPPELGEPELGSRIPAKSNADPTIYTQANASAAGYRLAQCFVGANARAAATYLTAPVDTDGIAEKKLGARLADCMVAQSNHIAVLQMSSGVFLGMLAEAFITRKPKAELQAAAAAKVDYAAAWMSLDPREQVVEQMAACLVDVKR